MEKSRPHVILSGAISLDGKIASMKLDSRISSKKDKKRLHKVRSKVDAILIGRNTVRHDDPLLTVRHVKGKNPIRVILDSNGTISTKSKIIKTCHQVPTIIAVSKKIPKNNFAKLKNYPVDVIIIGEKIVNVKLLLEKLAKKGIKSILLEGGGTVNWEFIQKDLVDEVILTIGPYLLGGKEAISLVQGKGFQKITDSPKLRLKKIVRMGDEVVLSYSHP